MNQGQGLLLLRYGNCRPVLTARKEPLSDIEQSARHFFNLPNSARLKFYASLSTIPGELVQIDPAVWSHVYGSVNSLLVEVEESPLSSTLVEISLPSTEQLEQPIFVKTLTGKTLSVTVGIDTTVNMLKAKIRVKEGIPINLQRLIFGGRQMEDDRPLLTYGVVRDSTIHLVTQLRGGKPVIYLYPPMPVSVNIRLSLISAWGFSATYPLALVKRSESAQLVNETVSWSVFAEPDGTLHSLDGSKLSYLFWEAETRPSLDIVTPPTSRPRTPELETSVERFDPRMPFLTPQNSVLLRVPADLTKYLDRTLLLLGFHTEARTSFITYWLPSFMKHEYISLRFLEQSLYDSAAHLTITPKPDIVARVFMLFRGIDNHDLTIWNEAELRAENMDIAAWQNIIGIDAEKVQAQNLFRVLEWGGMEVR